LQQSHDFSVRFPGIAKALQTLTDETLVDGEVAVLDGNGRPSFMLIQNHQSLKGTLVYFVFDVLVLKRKSVMGQTLDERRALLEKYIVPKLREPLRYMRPVEGSLNELVKSVKAHGLEGLVAKRRDSKYEPGERSGAWQKMRVNQGQEFVIGGYTPIGKSFDALVFGYYKNGKLLYASRTRNGFTPSSRQELLKTIKPLKIRECPFANLPEKSAGRWGAGLTAAKMKDCLWVLCRVRHSTHNVECRTMPHAFAAHD
jgi:bifunctional non-homologous end joining protein LigD